MKSFAWLVLGAALAYAYFSGIIGSKSVSAVGPVADAPAVSSTDTRDSSADASVPAPSPAPVPTTPSKEDPQPDLMAEAKQKDIKDQIKRLQDDVNTQQGRVLEHSDAQDRIDDDKEKIAELEKELN